MIVKKDARHDVEKIFIQKNICIMAGATPFLIGTYVVESFD